jgi:uncharacterized membrane protein YdbT with pleckstrin-like domain
MTEPPVWLDLDPGEELLWTGQPRRRRILGTVTQAVIVSIVAAAAAWAVRTGVPSNYGVPPIPVPDLAVVAVAALVVLTQVYSVVMAYLRTVNTGYALTTTALYKKTGVVSERTSRVGLDRIQNTELQKGLLGNLFDYGTVLVSTAGSSGADLAITDLDDPETFRTTLRSRMGARTNERDRPEPIADPQTIAEAVAEVRALRTTADDLATRLQR